MVVRTSLERGEHRKVDVLLKVVHYGFSLLVHPLLAPSVEDKSGANASQCLVCCCGDNIGVLERGRDDSSSNQTALNKDIGTTHMYSA